MRRLKTYNDFTNEEINLKKSLIGGAIADSTLAGCSTDTDLNRLIRLIIKEDYERRITINDFDFLNNDRIFSGWYVKEGDGEFLIKNKEFPFFEFAVFIGKGRFGSAKEYPWGYEARSIGGSNYPPHGHKGHYTIERNLTKNIGGTFKHFLMFNYNEILKTSKN